MKYHPMGERAVTAPTPKRSRMARFKGAAKRLWQKLKDFPLYVYVVFYLASREAQEAAERIVTAYWGPRKAA